MSLDLVSKYGLLVFNIEVCDAVFSDHMPVLFENSSNTCSVKNNFIIVFIMRIVLNTASVALLS